MDPFIGEVILFAGNFAPKGWAFCDGQLLPIAQYQALFSILGTTYGGDGVTTFALPDLRGRVPVGVSDSTKLGRPGGAATTTLTPAQLPPHSHQAIAKVAATDASGNTASPDNALWALDKRVDGFYTGEPGRTVAMAADAVTVSVSGGGQGAPVDNMQPYLGMTWLINVSGSYPPKY